MRPVMRDPPLCTLWHLHDGTVTLPMLADMHEAMDEQEEYQRRYESRSKT